MSEELEERLRKHAQSFDSLLSLIPAKLYYGEDVSDQWKRKKQTPEQKRAAKMAKLDPSNWKSAKDVLDERAAAAKRKRDQDDLSEDDTPMLDLEHTRAVQDEENPKTKKRRVEGSVNPSEASQALTVEEKKRRKAEKKAVKREKLQKEKEKLQRQKARKQAERAQGGATVKPSLDESLNEPVLLDQMTTNGAMEADQWSTASSSEGAPEILSPPAESGSSSISSIPPSVTEHPTKPNKSQPKSKPQLKSNLSQAPQIPHAQPAADRQAAKARLADAISSFRTARKADESSSNKPRNRAELLEQRRKKEEAKRLAKKEQRRKEREEAARLEDEEIARRFSPGGSGSLLASPRSPPSKDGDLNGNNNFSYGRIEFADGTKIDPSGSASLLPQHKRKGPQDAQTALLAAQKKAGRLAGLDEDKRKSIEEKDMWLAAKQRAHGERVKDNTSLLKKALKRQENQKKKSETEWTDRKDGIVKAQAAKQKKRTENLAKRKEEKQNHKAGGKKGTKVKKRPGFEGSFRGRTGGTKKKT